MSPSFEFPRSGPIPFKPNFNLYITIPVKTIKLTRYSIHLPPLVRTKITASRRVKTHFAFSGKIKQQRQAWTLARTRGGASCSGDRF